MRCPNAFILTGNLASGKSTAAKILEMYGFSVISADILGHEVLDENAGLIAKNFGDEILENGKISRQKLAKIVFNDKEKLKILENLTHPKIRAKIYEKAQILEKKKLPYFIEIPLFFEKRGDFGDDFGAVVLIFATSEISLKRARERDKNGDAALRLKNQMDAEKKRKMADFVIENCGDLREFTARINEFLDILRGKYANLKI